MKQIILYDRQVDWWTPVWSSALFGAITLAVAIALFQRRDFDCAYSLLSRDSRL